MAKVRRARNGIKGFTANYAIVRPDGSVKRERVAGTGKLGVTPFTAGFKSSKTAKRARKTAVVRQRVHGAGGQRKTVYAIDLGSSTLGRDLGYAFEKNVAKARRENKKKTGVADAVIDK